MESRLCLIRLAREETSIPWGFRIEGGCDVGNPLNIQKITPGSIAERAGLQAGDLVVRINSSDVKWMRHEDAKMEIIRSGNDIEMLIERGAAHLIHASAPVTMMPVKSFSKPSPQPHSPPSHQPTVWRPKVSTSPHQPQFEQQSYISLAATQHQQEEAIGVKHNISPVPFGAAPPPPGEHIVTKGVDGRFRQIGHSTYNSPMGLYHQKNVNETFSKSMSSYSSTKTTGPVAANSNQAAATRPGLTPTTVADLPSKYCGSCGDFIRGVFVKVQGRVPMHPECLKCCKCGKGLRNIGYFYINEQLYCETHAKQAAQPPAAGMKPLVVYK